MLWINEKHNFNGPKMSGEAWEAFCYNYFRFLFSCVLTVIRENTISSIMLCNME